MSSFKDLTFFQRLRQALAFKNLDVEEFLDILLHRPLAALIAVAVTYCPFVITPNQISLAGLIPGLAAAALIWDVLGCSGEWLGQYVKYGDYGLAYAGFLIFFWTVTDCADGQVARLCRRGTRTGRVLDGFIDAIIVVAVYLALGVGLGKQAYAGEIGKIGTEKQACGIWWFVVNWMYSFSGFSVWAHTLVCDRVKTYYCLNIEESSSSPETPSSLWQEFLEARQKDGYTLNTCLLGMEAMCRCHACFLHADPSSPTPAVVVLNLFSHTVDRPLCYL